MFNSVQLVRDLCKERNIPIAKLEKDCGFSNGYLNPKKMSKIPYDRAVIIADYLDVSANLILTGKQKENAPTENSERSIRNARAAFFDGYGDDLSEEEKDELWEDARVYAKFKAQQKK